MIPLRKSTASQEVLLGPFLDDTDGKTAETALTIANTDIKLWKRGGTTESSKNSGGATHIASGRYHATLDATDTDTTGELIINVAVAGALPVRLVCCVFEAAVFDAIFASGAAGYQVPIWSNANATVNLANTTIKAVTDSVAATVSDKTGYKLASDGLAAISAWSVTITGNLVGNVTGSVNNVTSVVSANVTQWNGGSLPTIGTSTLTAQQVWEYSGARTLSAFSFTVAANVTQWAGGALPVFPTHFGSLLINSSGHLSRVTLVDTTTTNTDMRGTDGAALATVWTATVAGRIDMPLSDIPTAGENADAVWDEVMSGHTGAGTYGGRLPRSDSSNVEVKLTGSAHIAADVHDLQPAVIEAQHFALGAIDANAVAADASSEIATAVRAELAVELARIDVTVGSRLATIAYTAPPTASTIADMLLGRSVSNVEATASEHSICTLVLAALESSVIGTSWTIKRTDGTTTHATKTVTTDASAEPITGVA
jgi:hypothetical protein